MPKKFLTAVLFILIPLNIALASGRAKWDFNKKNFPKDFTIYGYDKLTFANDGKFIFKGPINATLESPLYSDLPGKFSYMSIKLKPKEKRFMVIIWNEKLPSQKKFLSKTWKIYLNSLKEKEYFIKLPRVTKKLDDTSVIKFRIYLMGLVPEAVFDSISFISPDFIEKIKIELKILLRHRGILNSDTNFITPYMFFGKPFIFSLYIIIAVTAVILFLIKKTRKKFIFYLMAAAIILFFTYDIKETLNQTQTVFTSVNGNLIQKNKYFYQIGDLYYFIEFINSHVEEHSRVGFFSLTDWPYYFSFRYLSYPRRTNMIKFNEKTKNYEGIENIDFLVTYRNPTVKLKKGKLICNIDNNNILKGNAELIFSYNNFSKIYKINK